MVNDNLSMMLTNDWSPGSPYTFPVVSPPYSVTTNITVTLARFSVARFRFLACPQAKRSAYSESIFIRHSCHQRYSGDVEQ